MVTSRDTSPLIWVISIATLLISPLTTPLNRTARN